MAVRSSDQLTIIDVTDAYSVILTNDSYTFPGTVSAAKAGSCTTQIIAMRGSEQIAATVNLNSVTKPTGITVTKDNDATSPTLTITASTSFTTAGVVRIPVVVDGDITITKDFSVAIAFTGATGGTGPQGPKGDTGDTGKGVSGVSVTYQAGSSNTTAPTGTWQGTPPTVSEGQFLWTKMVLSYTDGTSSDPLYSVAKQGVSGTSAQWYTGTGITGTSTTAQTFSGSGVTNAKVGDMYLNTSTYVYTDGGIAAGLYVLNWVNGDLLEKNGINIRLNKAGTLTYAFGDGAAVRNALGLGSTTGALPAANGGTGQTSLQATRNAMGLGNTTGALPVANGGTGATAALGARTNLQAALGKYTTGEVSTGCTWIDGKTIYRYTWTGTKAIVSAQPSVFTLPNKPDTVITLRGIRKRTGGTHWPIPNAYYANNNWDMSMYIDTNNVVYVGAGAGYGNTVDTFIIIVEYTK